jgi:hypothetical protein
MHIVLLLWKQANSTKKEGQKKGKREGANGKHEEKKMRLSMKK